MKKIFIACPFIKYIDGTNFINENFRDFIEKLYDLCGKYADTVFLALKREEYGAKPLKKYSCLMDFEEAQNADFIIAIPDDSMGVAVELGWMSAMGKTMLIVLDKNQDYTPLVANINSITPGKVIFFENEEKNALPDIENTLNYYKMLIDGEEK